MKKSNITTLGLVIFAISVILNITIGYYVWEKWYRPIDPTHLLSYKETVQHFKKFPPIHPNDAVLLGDSRLAQLNTAEFLKDYFPIVNRSVGGEISRGLINRVSDIVSGHPKKIFIEIGVNDLWDRVTSDSLLKNIQILTQIIKHKSPESTIYILSILPTSKNHNRVAVVPLIARSNEDLRLLCNRNGFTFIDIYGRFSDNDGSLSKRYDTGDGIHLSDEGNKELSSILIPYLKK